MATWNHGDKTAGSTVQFNGKSYITRKDTGQTVYDTVASPAADPGLAAEIASIKTQLQSVSTGSGSGFGTVQFAGDNSSTYYYRKIKANTSNTVREEFETDVLAMSDGSVPSAAILMINCVNLNDKTFESPDKARAMMMYEPPADSTAAVSCYINSRGSSSSGGSGVNFITGTYNGDNTGQKANQPNRHKESTGIVINIGGKPLWVRIYGDKEQPLQSSNNFKANATNGVYDAYTYVYEDQGRGEVVLMTDTGFEVSAAYKQTTRANKGYTTTTFYGPNQTNVAYTWEALVPVSRVSATASYGTYGPGTQAIVPVHANGRAKLITHINKLAAGQDPDACFLEMWVVGLMGGGGSVPDNNYADLLKRVETLENNSATVTGTIDLGAVGYTFTAKAKRKSSSKGGGSWNGHTLSNFEPITDAIPSYADSDKNFDENTNGNHAITGEITNSSGTYRLLYSPPEGGTKTGKFGSYVGYTTVGTAFRVK